MPILQAPDYNPKRIFRNGHLNTMYPYLFRKKISPNYQRERFLTSDDDFVDLDFLKTSSDKLVILCHGLEGSSNSQYIQYISTYLSNHNWDVMAMNYRSCGGEINNQIPMYHS